MSLYLKCVLIAVLLVCSLYSFADGLSLWSRRHKQAISNRIRDNDISFFPILRQLTSSSNHLHRNNEIRKINDQTSRLQTGSSALSGVPGCDDCFLGLQVSRREAYVVSSLNHIFYDYFATMFLQLMRIHLNDIFCYYSRNCSKNWLSGLASS